MIYNAKEFIDFVISHKNLKLVIGASNSIEDINRFENIFDFGMSNEIHNTITNLNILNLNFKNFYELRSIPIKNVDNTITLQTEKFSLIVVDWSTIKFIPIKMLFLYSIYYLDIGGELYTEVCTFSERLMVKHNNVYKENDELEINDKFIGKFYLNLGIRINDKVLSIEKIIQNNYLYLTNTLENMCPKTFTVEYKKCEQYPNESINGLKKVNHYFKITKNKKCEFTIQQFRNCNILLIT